MTNAEPARFKRTIEGLHKQLIVLPHKLNAVSDSMTLSIMVNGAAMNIAECSSTTPMCCKPNKNFTADNLDVQVFAAMKKA